MLGGVWRKLRENVRDVVFGLEDSLVSTLGTVTGVAVASNSPFYVVLTGVILVCVEAISMAAGSYLSSKSAKELYTERLKQDHARVLHERISDNESFIEMLERRGFTKKEIAVALDAIGRERKLWLREVSRCEYRHSPSVSSSPILAAGFMGSFYLLGGFFTFIPYLFLPISLAMPSTIVLTPLALFFVGVFKAKLTSTNVLRSGIEMFIVSTSAAVIGYGLGVLVPYLFHMQVTL